MPMKFTRKQRAEINKWVSFYKLVSELFPSDAAKQAGRIVFASAPDLAAISTPNKLRPKPTVESLVRRTERLLLLANFRQDNPGLLDRSVYRQLHVDKRDWYRWQSGEMKDSSVMAKRIASFLRSAERFPPFPPLTSPHANA